METKEKKYPGQRGLRQVHPEEWLTEEGIEKIQEWLRNGVTMANVATNMGISIRTLYKWIHEYPEFQDIIKAARTQCTDIVENALYKHCVEDRDTKAIIFWLKNKRSADWKERNEQENYNHNDEKIVLEIR